MVEETQILILAMAPVSELRGAIPVGVSLGLPFWKVFLISYIGNLIPVIFLLLFLEPISCFLSKNFRIFKIFFNYLFKRTRRNSQPLIAKYGKLGLVLFVAIPLPVTGGWTGAITSWIFGFSRKLGFVLISLGILIAGGIVSLLTWLGIAIEKYFNWQTLIIIIFLVLFCSLPHLFPPPPKGRRRKKVGKGKDL